MGRKGTTTRSKKTQKKWAMYEVSKTILRGYHKELVQNKKQREKEQRDAKIRRSKLVRNFKFNYNPRMHVLLVGEANCSFARSIISRYRKNIADKLRKQNIPLPSREDIRKGVDPDFDAIADALEASYAAAEFGEGEGDMYDMMYGEGEGEGDVMNAYKMMMGGEDDGEGDLEADDDDEMNDGHDIEDEGDDEDDEDEDDEDEDEEGDEYEQFYFSNCGQNLIVTCYDSLSDSLKKYHDLPEILSELYSAGVQVIFDVDASNMYQTLSEAKLIPKQKFDRITFNFPHVGSGETDKQLNIRQNQQLILAYITNALSMLRKSTTSDSTLLSLSKATRRNASVKWDRGGQIAVTIKNGPPYDEWRIPTLVRVLNHNQSAAQQMKEDLQQMHPGALAGKFPKLMMYQCIPFLHECYDGYAHRRTIGFKTGLSDASNADITKGTGAKQYIFVRAPIGFVDKGLGITEEDNVQGTKKDTGSAHSRANGKRNKSGRSVQFKKIHTDKRKMRMAAQKIPRNKK